MRKFSWSKFLLSFFVFLSTFLVTNSSYVLAIDLDFDKDGSITVKDITKWTDKYNFKKGDSSWDAAYDLNSDGIVDIYDAAIIAKEIRDLPKITNLRTSSPSPQKLNKMIRLEAEMSNCPPETLYKFSAYFNEKWIVLQDFSPDSGYNWEPTFDTDYTLRVEVKTKDSKLDYDDSKEIYYKIENDLNIIEPNLIWDGDLVYNNNPEFIVLHHIEAIYASVYDIHRWHLENTWAGIGYHYYIRKDGSIYRGRPENARGAHSKNSNETSIGIACEGDYMKEETMPEAQKRSLVALGQYIRKKYNINAVYGHKDVYNTDCPGTYFPLDEMKYKILN